MEGRANRNIVLCLRTGDDKLNERKQSVLFQLLTKMDLTCAACSLPIGRKQKVKCKTCAEWSHRLCVSGISHSDYLQTLSHKGVVVFCCPKCADVEHPSKYKKL